MMGVCACTCASCACLSKHVFFLSVCVCVCVCGGGGTGCMCFPVLVYSDANCLSFLRYAIIFSRSINIECMSESLRKQLLLSPPIPISPIINTLLLLGGKIQWIFHRFVSAWYLARSVNHCNSHVMPHSTPVIKVAFVLSSCTRSRLDLF